MKNWPGRLVVIAVCVLAGASRGTVDAQSARKRAEPSTQKKTKGAELEIHLQGLFGLFMPVKAADNDGNVAYDPLYVFAPRAQDPLLDVQIPDDQKDVFKAGWLPPHYTVIQFFTTHLTGSAGNPGVHTVLLGPVNMKAHDHKGTEPAYTASEVEFSCAGSPKPVTAKAADVDKIPVVLKAADRAQMKKWLSDPDVTQRAATLDATLFGDLAKKGASIAARLKFACGEELTVAPPEIDGQQIDVSVSAAELVNTASGWKPEYVDTTLTTKRGGEIVLKRTIGNNVALIVNGSSLQLVPDVNGKVIVSVRTLPLDEIMSAYRPARGDRLDLEHFRLLYGLAVPTDKEKAPYYHYGWPEKPGGSPFCDNHGRFPIAK